MNTRAAITGVIVLLVIVAAGAAFFNRTGERGVTNEDVTENGGERAAAVIESDEPSVGQEDAPLTVHYWHDFQCPLCKRFEAETLPELLREYVETGEVRIVYRDFPFIGEHSVEAALVAHAVWNTHPEEYVVWHNAMFRAQDGENSGFGDRESILVLTAGIEGVDADAVARDVVANESEYRAEIDEDRADGERRGVRATPSFLIGEQRVNGAQPVAVFSQIIDAQLGK